ncbi:SacI homology domain-containing protein [Radiomyces spectabilis]|uniref:SacI homology domain-containing protein n=1 Tax=Radiomyces spectabilis TaxID=64574 RepID=UPI00221F3A78|nr:SacI homology domain-containing protein [Radiomyces spectabilis]KAI8391329.1 SacI homology domain-containing protein [Radiomyces spectabilis]
MQTHLLLREHPRALALRPTVLEEAPSGVLVFEQHTSSSGRTDRAVVELLAPSDFEDSQWRILHARPVFGCLGLINIQGECFVAIVTDCVSVGRIRAGEEVYKIQAVSFISLSSSNYDDIDFAVKDTPDSDDWDQSNPPLVMQHPCAQLHKLFSVGSFYFTPDFDLTKTVQARTMEGSKGTHSFDDHFLWNQFLISGLLEFQSKMSPKKQRDLERGGFLVFAIRGYVDVTSITTDNERYDLSVISKLSCKRAGTRFNSRGIDDNGHVANFVETEVVLYSERICYAFTQLRGSVPVFWEQQGMQLVNHKIQISRGAGATQPAVKRHFNELLDRYNRVCNVNLLAEKENTGESLLGNAYNAAVKQLQLPTEKVRMVNFDLHAECRGGNYDNVSLLMRSIRDNLDDYGYFLMDSDDNHIICKQKGIFRTNCMDCLDRTNLVQSELSKAALLSFLRNRFTDHRRSYYLDTILARHAHLWAENGDGLSKIYAGTGALKSAFTRTGKVTFMNVLSDATRSVNRFYINNFQDKARQEVIDQLLGKLAGQKGIIIHDPISDSVSHLMLKRLKDYSSSRSITIFCGTYNLNGKSYKGESLEPWLLQHFKWNHEEPDIYVIGFQEIVELSPQQVMATDAEKRKIWEVQIEQTLNSRPGGKSTYVLLRSNQLVGAALIVFVKADIVENIRNVESAIKKTGIMGIAGNKGAVAIRMEYGDTSFCFLAAHFASGHSNYEDRNADFHTINQGLLFLRGRTIDSHDNIVWVSDFNYRVSLPNEEAREYCRQENIDALLNADQLIREMRHNRVFPGYQEGQITFMPTYKYDNGTSTYDTSEKQRVPGWTDRIVYKGKSLRQIQYDRAELFTSDHRPVLALFEADIVTLDPIAKAKLEKELYKQSAGDMNGKAITASPAAISSSPPILPKRKPAPPPPKRRPSEIPVDNLLDISFDSPSENQASKSSSATFAHGNWWDDGSELPKADRRRICQDNPFERGLGLDTSAGTERGLSVGTPMADNSWIPISPVPVDSPNSKPKVSPGSVHKANDHTKKTSVSTAIGFWNNQTSG